MDFQLFAFSPVIFLALYKYRKYGVIWSVFLLIVSILVPVFNRVVLDLPHLYEAISHPNTYKVMIGFNVHYWGPINYIQTYIIGMLVAYGVRHKPNIYLGGRIGETLIWIGTILMTVSMLYWQRNFMVPGYPYEALNGLELPLYLLSHKIIYLSSFAWLIFACVTGRGGLFFSVVLNYFQLIHQIKE